MAQYFTNEGLQKLKDELAHIKQKDVPETKKLIAQAREFGDLKENAGYHDARDKMSFLLGRIEQLEGAINEAVIIEKKESDKIQIGSEIKILFSAQGGPASGGDEEQTYQIVAPSEADILKNKLSYQSPLGQQLIGKKIGDEFNFMAGNSTVKIKILEIS